MKLSHADLVADLEQGAANIRRWEAAAWEPCAKLFERAAAALAQRAQPEMPTRIEVNGDLERALHNACGRDFGTLAYALCEARLKADRERVLALFAARPVPSVSQALTDEVLSRAAEAAYLAAEGQKWNELSLLDRGAWIRSTRAAIETALHTPVVQTQFSDEILDALASGDMLNYETPQEIIVDLASALRAHTPVAVNPDA